MENDGDQEDSDEEVFKRWCGKFWNVYIPNYKAISQYDVSEGIKGFTEIADSYVSTLNELIEFINVKLNMVKDIRFVTYLSKGYLTVVYDLREIHNHIKEIFVHDYEEYLYIEEAVVRLKKSKISEVILPVTIITRKLI